MNMLIRKEARLLLPNFLICLGFTGLFWLIPQFQPAQSTLRAVIGILMLFMSPALLVILAISSLGREVSAGTLSHLLVQPLSRERIWWTKALLLAAAVIVLWFAWWMALSHNVPFSTTSPEDQRVAFVTSLSFAMAAYSSGLWLVLLLRHVAAAFWFTLLTPFTLIVIVSQLLQRREDLFPGVLSATLLVYSIGGFLFARWLFLRAQDAHWTGGTIALPRWRNLQDMSVPTVRARSPWLALVVKELRLQQSQFIIAAVLVLM